MTSPDALVYLLHIRDCCEEPIACLHLRQQSSVPPSILFSAVCRNLEIIGEAAKKIGPAYGAATRVCRLSCQRPTTLALSRTFVHAVLNVVTGRVAATQPQQQ